jgi:hypothetical protein
LRYLAADLVHRQVERGTQIVAGLVGAELD